MKILTVCASDAHRFGTGRIFFVARNNRVPDRNLGYPIKKYFKNSVVFQLNIVFYLFYYAILADL